jgi:hypothetical protein
VILAGVSNLCVPVSCAQIFVLFQFFSLSVASGRSFARTFPSCIHNIHESGFGFFLFLIVGIDLYDALIIHDVA